MTDEPEKIERLYVLACDDDGVPPLEIAGVLLVPLFKTREDAQEFRDSAENGDAMKILAVELNHADSQHRPGDELDT